MTEFSTTPDALSAEQLTKYLKASGALCDGRVVSAEQQIIGTGKMGDNARFTLCYEVGQDAEYGGAPDTLIAKFPAADEHARAMAGAHGAYYNEVMFYRELAASTAMRTPKIYGSELSDDRSSFLLLMEDMSPAEPGNNLLGESREHASLALGQVAKLAAAFYGDASLEHRDYVVSAARDDGGAFAQSLMQQCWSGFVDRFGHGITPQCIAFGEHYVGNVCHFVTRYPAWLSCRSQHLWRFPALVARPRRLPGLPSIPARRAGRDDTLRSIGGARAAATHVVRLGWESPGRRGRAGRAT